MSRPSWCSSDVVLLDEDCPLPFDVPFTPQQAATEGVPRGVLRVLYERGLVRRLLQGVYGVAQLPDTIGTRCAALRLVVPDSAIVTDRTAAWLHGVDIQYRSAPYVPPPISVFSASGSRLRRPGVASGIRGLRSRDVTRIDGLRVTTPLRTACDLGRLLWRFDALAALDGFLRLGVDHDELLAEVERYKGYRGVRQLRAFAPLADGRAESPPESALRLHWYDAGLPRPEPQVWVYDDDGVAVFRVDLALEEVLFGAEFDGKEFHSSDEDRDYDADRRAWMTEHRKWTFEIFEAEDIYGRLADPGPRLRAGIAKARQSISRWTLTRHS
ncbi:hypothetical protein [Nocardioides speluncae]|uniref:hypothetical protein n=1 Tax=Nocardioides speluncae TaxID=2670337 RepID=UPI0012B181F4|nr:hypothetical protein [Nocardioides speluncae]